MISTYEPRTVKFSVLPGSEAKVAKRKDRTSNP
jgi:hypothetical protein